MSIASSHRDAARVLRAEANKYEKQLNKQRVRFYRDQAQWHESQAERVDEEGMLQDRLYNMILLHAKETHFSGGAIGYLINTQNEHLSLVIIQHAMLGNLYFDIPTARLPKWIPIWPEPLQHINEEASFDEISDYLRVT